MDISLINKTLALGTIASQAFILFSVLYVIFFRNSKILGFFEKNGIILAFLVSLSATLASLFYSNVAGFAPCDLCWIQRIFMYPLAFFFAIALWKKNYSMLNFAWGMSIIGFFISLYQNYLYYANSGLIANCPFASAGVSCIKRYVFEFGYVTIPIMALTAFALIIVFLILARAHPNYNA